MLVDPHTADGVHVASEFVARHGDTLPMVVLETALPVKFAATIREAIGRDPEVPPAFAHLAGLGRHVVEMKADAQALKQLIAEHA